MIDAFDRPSASAAGDSAQEGNSGAAARADHRHQREAADANLSGTPTTSAVGDSAAVGTSTTGSRSDHRHGREAFATPVAVGAANSAGSATTIPRSDHVHNAITKTEVLNVGGTLVGGAPTVSTTQFYWQGGTTVITYATGGSTITFPTAFAIGLVSFVAIMADGAATVIVPVNSAVAKTGFKIKVFDMAGAEVGAGGGYRINWMALGW